MKDHLKYYCRLYFDICTHIVSSLVEVPSSYTDCINILSKNGVLETKLSRKVTQAVKMRNIISHQYLAINYEILYAALIEIVINFEEYKKAIRTWMRNQ